MLNVAYISRQLGLVGNSEASVAILLSKNKFRKLQKDAGVFAPEHCIVASENELLKSINKIRK